MNPIETTMNAALPDDAISIRATSGAKRVEGKMQGGEERDYTISREKYLALCDQIFTLSMGRSKDDNDKSGGLVSQTLHSYGVTAKKEATYGSAVFPADGEEWTDEHTEKWLVAMNMKKPREAGARKTAKEHKMDALLLVLNIPGVTWEAVKVGYPDITAEELEAYKAKLAAVVA